MPLKIGFKVFFKASGSEEGGRGARASVAVIVLYSRTARNRKIPNAANDGGAIDRKKERKAECEK